MDESDLPGVTGFDEDIDEPLPISPSDENIQPIPVCPKQDHDIKNTLDGSIDVTNNLSCSEKSSSSDDSDDNPDSESHPVEHEDPVIHSPADPVQTLSNSSRSICIARKEKENLKHFAISPPPEERSPTPCSPVGGILGWRPVLPGYHAPRSDTAKVLYPNRRESSETGEHGPGHTRTTPDLSLKDYIPAMPRPLALVCFVFNIISPGFGTLLSGVSVLCCSSPRPKGTERLHCVWVNAWVSVLQLLTTFLLLLGWVWSIMWGTAFVAIAGKVAAEENEEADTTTIVTARSCSSQNQADDTVVTSHRDSRGVRDNPTGGNYYQRDRDHASMIVLQDTPILVQRDSGIFPSRLQPHRILNPYNPRHQRVMRRQNTEEELLPSYLLDSQALENIVIRNAPVPDQLMFGRQDGQGAGQNTKAYGNQELAALRDELNAGPSSQTGGSGSNDNSTRARSNNNIPGSPNDASRT